MAGAARMRPTGRRNGLAHMPQVDHAQLAGGSRLAALETVERAGRDHPARRRLFHGRGLALLRLVTDVVMVGLGTAMAVLGAPAPQTSGEAVGLVWLFPPLVLALMAIWGLYRDSLHLRRLEGIGQVLAATSLAAVALIAAVALFYPAADPAPLVGRAWLFGTLYLVAARLLLGWAHRRARLTRLAAKPTLIVGAGEVGAHVERRLLAQPELGLLPGRLPGRRPALRARTPARRCWARPPSSTAVARETGAEHVVMGFSSTPDERADPARPRVRGARAQGLSRAAAVRVRQRTPVARAPRRPAAVRPARDQPQGLAVRHQARARPPRSPRRCCCSSRRS